MNKNILTRIHLFVLCAIIVSLITSCSGREAGSTYQYQVPSDISDGWESASLEDAGIDSKKISALMEDIQDGGFKNIHSLLIVKDGRSVFEEYFRGHKQTLLTAFISTCFALAGILPVLILLTIQWFIIRF